LKSSEKDLESEQQAIEEVDENEDEAHENIDFNFVDLGI
jgi:hypothetical protein